MEFKGTKQAGQLLPPLHDELDVFLLGLEEAGAKFTVHDFFEVMEAEDAGEKVAEPFASFDIVVVLESNRTHYFFNDGVLLGSSVLVEDNVAEKVASNG